VQRGKGGKVCKGGKMQRQKSGKVQGRTEEKGDRRKTFSLNSKDISDFMAEYESKWSFKLFILVIL
jgi:hypothetical protein